MVIYTPKLNEGKMKSNVKNQSPPPRPAAVPPPHPKANKRKTK